MKEISDKAKMIGNYRKNSLPIESIYDNTIGAIKIRIERCIRIDEILRNKNKYKTENKLKRNNVVIMNQLIKNTIEKTREANFNRIKELQHDTYRNMNVELKKAQKKFHKLEGIESNMIINLVKTRNIENNQIKASILSLDSIKSKNQKRYGNSFDNRKVSFDLILTKPKGLHFLINT